MKIFLRHFLVILLLPFTAAAQDDDQWPSLEYLRGDYRSSSVVAYVRIHEAEIVNRIGGYEDWRVVCEVIEPFKGKFRKGDKVEYYHGAEAGFRKEWFSGEKIIFLVRNFHEKERRWIYAVLENSTLPYAKHSIEKLRMIKRRVRLKKRPSLALGGRPLCRGPLTDHLPNCFSLMVLGPYILCAQTIRECCYSSDYL